MKIVIVSDWYSEKMGYSENCLARTLSQLGHSVFLITSTAQVYYNEDYYEEVYEKFLGPKQVNPGIIIDNNYTILRLPILLWWKRLRVFKSLYGVIKKLNPDIVQCYEPLSSTTLQLALMTKLFRYKLFTAIHTVASVYPAYYDYKSMSLFSKIRLKIFDTYIGKMINLFTERTYGATIDATEIGHRYFGIPKSKLVTDPLGVETDLFHPNHSQDDIEIRQKMRIDLGIPEDGIICIYTGRFTQDKNPLVLANAIGILSQKGKKYYGLFIGIGPQGTEIIDNPQCIIRPFMPYYVLPAMYRASDIGVWPRQESTSMIDAAASGLPIVVSNKLKALERVIGNGLMYEENDPNSLSEALLALGDQKIRAEYGKAGEQKMRESFSWLSIAKKRVSEYAKFAG